MALDADALTTLVEVKTLLALTGVTEDARLEGAINQASARILRYIDRTIKSTPYTEFLDGTGTTTLQLTHWPIISVTQVNVDTNRDFLPSTVLVENTDFVIEKPEGILRLLEAPRFATSSLWPRGIQNTKVVYTAGFATTPRDLERIAVDLAAYYYKTRGQRGHKRVAIGGIDVVYDPDPSGIPDSWRGALDSWRRMDSSFTFWGSIL